MIKIKQISFLIILVLVNFSLKSTDLDPNLDLSSLQEKSSSNKIQDTQDTHVTTVLSADELDNLIAENLDNTNNPNHDNSANSYVWFPENIRSKILYIRDAYKSIYKSNLSEDFKNLADHLANGGTVSLYESTLKVVDECINCISLLKIKNTSKNSEIRAVNTNSDDSENLTDLSNLDTKELKNLFKQYKEDLLSGDALVTVTQEQIDQNADMKPITRRGKCKVYCKLLVRDVLKVAGTLCVDGDGVIKFLRVTTDAVVSGKLNVGSLFINGQPVSANSGNISGSGNSVENGIAIFTNDSGETIESSGVVIDNDNNISGIENLTVNGEVISNGPIILADGNGLRLEAPITRQTGNERYILVKAGFGISKPYILGLPASIPTSSGQVLQVEDISANERFGSIRTKWGSISNEELENIYLPNTDAASSTKDISGGIVYKNNVPFLHNAGVDNVFLGENSGTSTTTSSGNIAIGTNAGLSLKSGSNNIYLGNKGEEAEDDTTRIGNGQKSCYIAGIYGTSTSGSYMERIVVDENGQLGQEVPPSSSRRYKKDIEDMGKMTDSLKELRPVVFKYKSDESNNLQFGLIAEEVAEVYPELIMYKDGKPEGVKYHLLSSMLLNEVKKLMISQQAQDEKISKLIRQIGQLKKLNKLNKAKQEK